ncbi:MAG: thermonuclease family protein [Myxococcota bacterium]|nr:thermonuclease family protein [Myxococcota bacterium]
MSYWLLLLSACNREIPILVNDWCAPDTTATVTEVVDGDTIRIDSGETVRLLGIDAPELFHDGMSECTSEDSFICCYGADADDWLTELLPAGTVVKLGFDLECEDIYNRTLAYVWLPETDDTGSSDLFLNEEALRSGYARLFDEDIGLARDIRYYERFQDAQTTSQSNGSGLWSACY